MVFERLEKNSHENLGIADDLVSVGKTTISFGKKAQEFLTEEYVAIYLDKDNNLVGLKPTNNYFEGYKLLKTDYVWITSRTFKLLIPQGRYKISFKGGFLVFKVPKIEERK